MAYETKSKNNRFCFLCCPLVHREANSYKLGQPTLLQRQRVKFYTHFRHINIFQSSKLLNLNHSGLTMNPKILYQFRSRSPIFDWYLFTVASGVLFFQKFCHYSLAFNISETYKIGSYFVCFRDSKRQRIVR